MSAIPQTALDRQAWKYYFVLSAWPAYLFILPYVYKASGAAVILFMIFPGVYLFTWLSLLVHETWHRSTPGVPNTVLYHLFSWMLVTDPQLYSLLHSSHHSDVHSWEDVEFHPFGNIRPQALKIFANMAEIVLGMIYLMLAYAIVVPRHPRCARLYRHWKFLLAVFVWSSFLGGLIYVTHRVFGVQPSHIVVVYFLSYWLGAIAVRHSQLVEHGNLIVAGDWETRNLRSRNLKDSGLFEKLFLLLTHGDAREHVLHHTVPNVYSRPFPRHVPMPDNAVYITLHDYGKILRDMLMGRESSF
jgi:uncharacterized membrane protein